MTLPSGVAGLVGWYGADGPLWQDTARTVPAVADNDPVGSWDDRSGSANHAQQGTAGHRPLLKLAVQHGKPAIRFDGADDLLTLLTNFTVGPSSVFAVLKGTNVASYSGIFVADKIGVYNAGAGGNVWGVYTSSFDYAGQEVYSRFRQISAVIRAPNDMDLVTDGVLLHSSGGSSYQARGATAIGADPSGAQNSALDVCELLVYNTPVSASDRKLIEDYLQNKWFPDRHASDTFHRADDSTHLNNADTGQTWIQQAGAWGISGSAAYCSDAYAGGNGGIATVDLGAVVASVTATVARPTPVSTWLGVVARYSDINNYWFAFVYQGVGGGSYLYAGKCVGGSFSYNIISGANLGGTPYPFKLILAVDGSDNWSVFLNDALYATHTDSFNNTATLAGIFENGCSNPIDGFLALSVGSPASPTAQVVDIAAYGTRAYGGGVPVREAPSGGPTTYNVSLSGAVTPAGVLHEQVGKVSAGSVSSSGGLFLVGPDGIFLVGSITPVGGLVKRDAKSPSGVIGPTGSLSLVLKPGGSDTTLRAGFLPIA